jgi:hypothetical protein
MRKARKRLETVRNAIALHAEGSRGGVGERRVLPIVGAAKRPCASKIGRRRCLPSGHHPVLTDPNVGVRRLRPRDSKDVGHAGARLQPRIDGAARLIVDADQRDFGLRHQPFLDRGIAGKIAMPVEMVRRDVDQQPDAGSK